MASRISATAVADLQSQHEIRSHVEASMRNSFYHAPPTHEPPLLGSDTTVLQMMDAISHGAAHHLAAEHELKRSVEAGMRHRHLVGADGRRTSAPMLTLDAAHMRRSRAADVALAPGVTAAGARRSSLVYSKAVAQHQADEVQRAQEHADFQHSLDDFLNEQNPTNVRRASLTKAAPAPAPAPAPAAASRPKPRPGLKRAAGLGEAHFDKVHGQAATDADGLPHLSVVLEGLSLLPHEARIRNELAHSLRDLVQEEEGQLLRDLVEVGLAEAEAAALVAEVAKIREQHSSGSGGGAQAVASESTAGGDQGAEQTAPASSAAGGTAAEVADAADAAGTDAADAGGAAAAEPGSISELLKALGLDKYEGAIAELADDLHDLRGAALDDLEDESVGMSKEEAEKLLTALRKLS
jgi:hypothetical protein